MDVLCARNKENPHPKDNEKKQIQNLRIELNDKLFQVRKLEEDQAQERAQFFLNMQKQKQNSSKIIQEMKLNHEQENQAWASKVEQIRKYHSSDMQQLESTLKQQAQDQQQQIQAALLNRFTSQRILIEKQLEKEKVKHSKEIEELALSHESQRKKLREDAKQEQQLQANSFKRERQSDRKAHEEQLGRLKKIMLQQQAIREQFQAQKIKSRQQYIQQNTQWVIKEQAYSREIATLEGKVRELQTEIKFIGEASRRLEVDNEEALAKIRQSHQLQIDRIQHQHENELKIQRHKTEATLKGIRQEVSQLMRVHQQKEKLWEERGRQILNVCQQQQSKREDVRAIESLENELIKRDCMLERERKELLNCRLELENMEDIYGRIFDANHCPRRLKSKNFKIKKLRNSSLLHPENFSAVLPPNEQ